jgi:hypothetical protein
MAQFSWRFVAWFSALLLLMAACAVISVCMVVRVHAADHCACLTTDVPPSLKG